MDKKDPFLTYYQITFGNPEASKQDDTPSEQTKDDALSIRDSINVFIKNMNTMIGKIFDEEKVKGTRTDLIVTLVVGGLAFTLANVYFLITKNLGASMAEKEYEDTVMKMFRSAIKDIKKNGV